MFPKFLGTLRGHGARHKARKRRTVLLSLEQLETRVVPAVISTWNWTPKSPDHNWSTNGNWTNGVPKVDGDQATFNGTSVGDARVDIDVVLANLNITNAYTGTINNTVGMKLTGVNSTMAGGTFTGTTLEIDTAGIFDWTGGTFKALNSLIVNNGAVINITGTGYKTLDAVSMFSVNVNATANWDGAGTIAEKNGSLISATGFFDITGGGTIDNGGGNTSEFDNLGTLTVNPGAGNTVRIHVLFENGAAFSQCNIQSGTLFVDGGSILNGTISVPQGAQLSLASISPNVDSLHGVGITGVLRP
jgi:hypothetical protein